MALIRGFYLLMLLAGLVQIPLGGVFRSEMTMVEAKPGQEVGAKFSETATARHWLLGYIQGRQPSVRELVAKHVRSDEEVADLTVTTSHRWTDNLLAGVTLFIYSPVTIEVKGHVAKARTAATPESSWLPIARATH
jgi:hypothetical protein